MPINDENPVDKVFQRAFEEHKIEPSAQVWERVKRGKKGRRVGPIFILRAAAIALLIGLNALFFYQNNENTLDNIPLESNKPSIDTPSELIYSSTLPGINEDHKEESNISNHDQINNKSITSNNQTPKSIARNKKTFSAFTELDLREMESFSYSDKLDNTEELHLGTDKKLQPRKVEVDLSKMAAIKGDYKMNSLRLENTKNELWAYASKQFNNLLAGKKLEKLPKPKGEIVIPLPQIKLPMKDKFNFNNLNQEQ